MSTIPIKDDVLDVDQFINNVMTVAMTSVGFATQIKEPVMRRAIQELSKLVVEESKDDPAWVKMGVLTRLHSWLTETKTFLDGCKAEELFLVDQLRSTIKVPHDAEPKTPTPLG